MPIWRHFEGITWFWRFFTALIVKKLWLPNTFFKNWTLKLMNWVKDSQQQNQKTDFLLLNVIFQHFLISNYIWALKQWVVALQESHIHEVREEEINRETQLKTAPVKNADFCNEMQPLIKCWQIEISMELDLPSGLSYIIQLSFYSIMPKQYFIYRT